MKWDKQSIDKLNEILQPLGRSANKCDSSILQRYVDGIEMGVDISLYVGKYVHAETIAELNELLSKGYDLEQLLDDSEVLRYFDELTCKLCRMRAKYSVGHYYNLQLIAHQIVNDSNVGVAFNLQKYNEIIEKPLPWK